MCSRLFPTFFSISFSVSGFMWRSLIHLDFSFVQDDKNVLICIFYMLPASWNSTIYWQCCPPPPTLDDFSFFVKDQVTIGVWVHFWVFSSIPLIYQPVTVPIPCSFLSLLFCSTAWGQGWWFPQKLLLLLRIVFPILFCYSRWICKLLFLTLQTIELEFWWGLHWICRLFLAR